MAAAVPSIGGFLGVAERGPLLSPSPRLLISHLEAEGVLTPDGTGVIYDKAIQLLQERVGAGAEDVAPTLHAEGSRLRR